MENMTSKQRMIAAINLDEVDRLPFWAKLDGGYIAYDRKKAFKGMSIDDLHDWLGSDRQTNLTDCFKITSKKSEFIEVIDGKKKTFKYITDIGTCTAIHTFDSVSCAYHPTRMPINTLDDIRIMTKYYNDCDVIACKDKLAQHVAEYKAMGDKALCVDIVGESPLMYFVEWLAGIQNAQYLLFDHEDEVEELFEAIHGYLLKITKVIAKHSVADMTYLVENTSTTLISPTQYAKYCLDNIKDYGRILNENDKTLALHMCGHLKDLLPLINQTPAKVYEAFTSPTVGNTRLVDGRQSCPDKCLFGGTNASLWMQPANVIIGEIESDLDSLAHHRGIMASSAGVMPPMCEPETIKQVFEFIKDYKVRF